VGEVKKKQMEILKLKTIITKMVNLLDGLQSKKDRTGEGVSKFEDGTIELPNHNKEKVD
jgi:hypothetical protein